MSCSSAPATRSICAPISPRCWRHPCPSPTATGSRACSAIWSGSGWTRPTWRGAPAADARIEAGMEYVTLGRTGLRVSVAGLGCGGFSRLGLGTGKSQDDAVRIVRQAMDLGVNLLDTAAAYGTEAIVGEAVGSVPRDSVVIATKAWIPRTEGRRAAERAVE